MHYHVTATVRLYKPDGTFEDKEATVAFRNEADAVVHAARTEADNVTIGPVLLDRCDGDCGRIPIRASQA